jgi:dTDP-4-amino-4,6-dideoxygalactose transaminase
MKVPFNQPYMAPISLKGAAPLRTQGKYYTACKTEIKKRFGFNRVILTPTCTHALEMVALCLNIQPGDEVILPSYTYVSTANAFALRGAKLVFVDSNPNHPSIDINKIEQAITQKTKAIVVVHYGGAAMDYNGLKRLKKKVAIPLVEDAAHCFGSKAGKNFIGSVGDFSTFSFHETKNITCGQGGALIVNNVGFWDQVNLIAQCGTDKFDFIKNKVGFYSWKALGSNSLLAEPLCAILLANIKLSERINNRRKKLWLKYHRLLQPLQVAGYIQMPPEELTGNGHIFYLLTKSREQRDELIRHLKSNQMEATFHYYPLHLSSFIVKNKKPVSLKNTEIFGERLVRLPLFYELSDKDQKEVIARVKEFYLIGAKTPSTSK